MGDANEVVKLLVDHHIAIVKMEEREYKNTLTHRLTTELKKTFNDIQNNPEIKVVVLQGYENYFCCGGTKEELIQLTKGNVNFTDFFEWDLLLKCKVPVISAMQGHALGAGLTLGCSADIFVMGEECIYSANFMKYGFTPGTGATLIIPEKFGYVLGTEMLMCGNNYFGRELKQRGVDAKIVKKKEVIDTAIRIATDLAEKPLRSLILLKKHLSKRITDKFSDCLNQELMMHQYTFNQPEVLQRIEKLY